MDLGQKMTSDILSNLRSLHGKQVSRFLPVTGDWEQ